MIGIQFSKHGLSDVLDVSTMDKPGADDNQVLVEIKAASLNHLDLWLRRGLPGLNIPLPHIPGSDASGVIAEVGSKVKDWHIGDEVLIQPGTFCGECDQCQAGREDLCASYGILGETQGGVQRQYMCLSPANIGPKPKNLSFVEAAALPLASLTAWNMLKNRARLRSGETLLVLGAGSGVGSMAVQIGRHMGARVIATGGSEEKQKLAFSLGADEVLNHRQTGFSKQVRVLTNGRGADVVFEHIGASTWADSMKSLAVGGRIVTCGATTGVKGGINLRHLFYKRQTILGSTMGSVSDFYECIHLAEQKALVPVIDKTFAFQDIRGAHDHLEFEHAFGKVVLEGWD
ncbi:MAG: zinc-binding dehydrogenase [Candidatus Marinimicrobia bacterium]|jgi:NADPH:quinone reductase-like Zn-dependent oxidoreductase|nr:zinc-binding dehydrogenase [Candidatus Neomarinimicrobiota bacterium]MBT4360328.1 zinc-binding dehydrogenase [Candidatus Neomarinimicrobiota bacterium]MBT4714545.1 zinc-binding dehydrogenase [Candidatus Neomarinimicrobiota bacterium]MBT4946584.1 zinc-binding dehydrogenase [Candidatus Neomarinimicrobiota bacterium]MBT5270337.1 zinc-binding dehydrogenase [Candidatus Neomarinimicrobiota bacterium]